MDRQVSSRSECDTVVDRLMVPNASLMRDVVSSHILGAQAIGRLDFLQWLAPIPLSGLKFFDSQFDSVAWRCLSLCRHAEAMRIAVVVGKDKLGLPIVSMF